MLSYRVLKVGVYENPPKVFREKADKPSGIFVEILEYIAQKEGWKLEYVRGSWTECLGRLERGEIDILVDVAYTPQRSRIFQFHKVPVLSSWFQVFARKGSEIKSIFDLDEKQIAVLERSIQKEVLEQLADGFEIEFGIVSMQDFKDVFEAVKEARRTVL